MINIVWLKRDFRLSDHAALHEAMQSGQPTLLVFLFEDSIYSDDHYSQFHLDFIKQSISDMNERLLGFGTKVLAIHAEIIEFLEFCKKEFNTFRLLSSEETGLNITFQRDINVGQWCEANSVEWTEFQNNAIIRAKQDRKSWSYLWTKFMKKEINPINWDKTNFIKFREIDRLQANFKRFDLSTQPKDDVQFGGSKQANYWLNSFLDERHELYVQHISKPAKSRKNCSRLSPYIAWGNLSVRQVYQAVLRKKLEVENKRNLSAFTSRLRWQAHFIQKFEMEPRMEFEAHNRGFLSLEFVDNKEYIKAWKTGKTGYPLVDASVRCLMETGYVNFRMRTMISSFFCHHLFQHFTHIGPWLARNFLDFEPGIHYPQLQMQSGLTGYNTVRVYNPTKNAKDHDSDAVFIKRYVPELEELPANLAIEPWLITQMEEKLYDFKLERDYYSRIVDMAETRKFALSKLYGHRKIESSKFEKERILKRHTIPRKRK